MNVYDPARPESLVHHGTFNNNVFMLAAGAAGLENVFTPPVQAALNDAGDALRASLNDLADGHGVAFQATGLGSLMNLHRQRAPIRSIRDIEPRDPRLRQLLHLDLIDKGFFTTRRGYITLSLAIAEPDLTGLIEAVDGFLTCHGRLLDTAPAE